MGRTYVGVVWGLPEDMVAHNRLKDIEVVYDVPPLSEELLQTVDWVARYTLAAPGMVLRAVLRSSEALEPERPVVAYRRTGHEPERMTPARHRVLETVADGLQWAKTAIVGASGVSASVVEGLEKAGALERLEVPPAPIVRPPDPNRGVPTLNPEQGAALADIRAIDAMHYGVALLDGITGSGKTEVFFEAVADTLRAGRQVLILLPEIALTHTFSAVSPSGSRRRPNGIRDDAGAADAHPARVMNGTVRAVVGARSALFCRSTSWG